MAAMEQLLVLLRQRDLGALELAEAEQVVLSSPWEQAQKDEVLAVLQEKRRSGGRAAGAMPAAGPPARAPMQDWLYFPLYLTEEIWELVLAKKHVAALSAVLQHLRGMGLRHPSEPTQAMLAALLLHDRTELELKEAQDFFQTCKAAVKTHLSGRTAVDNLAYVVFLPGDVQTAAPSVRQAAGAIVPPKLDLLHLRLVGI